MIHEGQRRQAVTDDDALQEAGTGSARGASESPLWRLPIDASVFA